MSEGVTCYPPGTKVHRLKTWPEYFEAILSGRKTFEVRKDDRDFAVGDVLSLLEWRPDLECHTGRGCDVQVTYKMTGGQFGLEYGSCVLGIKPYGIPSALSVSPTEVK